MKRTERILKSRLSQRIQEITLHPPGILMDPRKKKACDRTKTASD
jgi:hypothetical protein